MALHYGPALEEKSQRRKLLEAIIHLRLDAWRKDGGELRKSTNQKNKGLISAARSNKATRLLTIPRSLFKSSAKDLSSAIFEIISQRIPGQRFRHQGQSFCYGSRDKSLLLHD